MNKIFSSGFGAILMLVSLSLAADQYAVTLRDSKLVDKPFRDASAIGSIISDTQIVVLKRKGGWYQVRSDDQTGWVRLTNLRLQRGGPKEKGPGNNKNKNKGHGKGKASTPGQQKKKIGSLDTLGEALTGGLFTTGSSSRVTSTTGIRGLDEEDIGNASPNPAALAQLEKFSVSADQAERFAGKAKLNRTKLDYLAGDSASKGSGGLLDFFGGGNTQQEEEDSP